MTRVRVEGFTISLDGYGAGPNQDIRNPLGVGGTDLHQWLVPTRTLQRTLFGADGGTTGIDDDFAARGFKNVGAWILGRNMFGPIRGSWPDMNWKGWWGDNPPYHVPTFILTHHARPPIQMEGGTTFYFVTGGIHEALDRARDAANGMDVRIGGGPNTIQQYLRTGLIDELHVAISPVLLGGGERLFEGIEVSVALTSKRDGRGGAEDSETARALPGRVPRRRSRGHRLQVGARGPRDPRADREAAPAPARAGSASSEDA
jgi:dihydrofolate reductase